jgi:hypothetical protein
MKKIIFLSLVFAFFSLSCSDNVTEPNNQESDNSSSLSKPPSPDFFSVYLTRSNDVYQVIITGDIPPPAPFTFTWLYRKLNAPVGDPYYLFTQIYYSSSSSSLSVNAVPPWPGKLVVNVTIGPTYLQYVTNQLTVN